MALSAGSRRLLKIQMPGAREWASVGVLMQYVGASPSERNEAGGLFQLTCMRRSRSVKHLASKTKHLFVPRFIFGSRINL